ncbi:MAG: V-type ATPase subunit, partial [Planctomycetes bacterium]|nr:V-type ATPase subunit [Planctomycetota bacterium]
MALRTPTDLDFLAANIHGRRSRLAEAARLDALVRLRSLPELARALVPEGPFLTAVELQRALVAGLLRELGRIASQAAGASGDLLDWLRVRFQVEDLKVLVRGFAAHLAPDELQPHLIGLPEDLALDAEALAAAESIEAFAAAVPQGPLRDGLARAVPLYNRLPRPFFPEAGLDCGYLGELVARAGRLGGIAGESILEIARQEANTFHLMLVVRGRFSYGLKPEMLLPFRVPGSHVAGDAFGRMVAAEDLAAVASQAVGLAIDAPPSRAEALDAAALESAAWD